MTTTRWMPDMPPRYDVWRGLWDSLIGPKGPSPKLPLRSLSTVLQEIAFQARLDQLAHPASRNSLKDDLTDALRVRSGRPIPPELSILIRLFNEAKGGTGCPQWRLMEAAATQALADVGTGDAAARVDAIASIVTDTSNSAFAADLEAHSASVIVDLLAAGYSAAFVARLPEALAAGYSVHGDHLLSSIPFELFPAFSAQELSAKVAFLQTLSVAERIRAIGTLLRLPLETFFVTFQVRGLALETPLAFGDVVVYDPVLTPRIRSQDRGTGLDLLRDEDHQETRYPSIEVSIHGRGFDTEGMVSAAVEVAERHLDLMSAFLPDPVPLDLQRDRYVVCTADHLECGGAVAVSSDVPWIRYRGRPDLSEGTRDAELRAALCKPPLARLITQTAADQANRTTFAIAAVRRGDQSTRPQDSLLAYWSALEALLDVPSSRGESGARELTAVVLAQRLLPAACFLRAERFRLGWRIHERLCWYNRSSARRFPESLVLEAQLEPSIGETIHLRTIVSALPRLRAAIVPGPDADYLATAIDEAVEFYSRPASALAQSEAFEKRVKRDLDIAYRHRNRLVHDACDYTRFLPTISNRLGSCVHVALHFALEGAGESSTALLSRWAALEIRFAALQDSLRQGLAVDLLGDEEHS